jgi:hypothetical protein
MAPRRPWKTANSKKKKKDDQWNSFFRDVLQIDDGPLWRIDRPAQDKVVAGRGLITKADIPRGTLSLTDEPFLVLETDIDDSTAFYQSERAETTRIIAVAVEGLAAGKRTILRKLH